MKKTLLLLTLAGCPQALQTSDVGAKDASADVGVKDATADVKAPAAQMSQGYLKTSFGN